METDATRMCALIVGLPSIVVLGVEGEPGVPPPERPPMTHVSGRWEISLTP